MTRGLTKKQELDIEKRRSIVAANILAGLNYRDIAKGLEVSIGTVANDAKMILKRWQKEQYDSKDAQAQIDLRRIDTAIHAIWDDVKTGKLGAIDRLERLIARREAILGYSAPARINTTVTLVNARAEDLTDDELAEIIARDREWNPDSQEGSEGDSAETESPA